MESETKQTHRHQPKETASVGEVADRLAISRTLAYKLAREGRLPVPVIRLRRRVVVPCRALDRLLSNDDAAA
jgi:excisionase family DNA binding protein